MRYITLLLFAATLLPAVAMAQPPNLPAKPRVESRDHPDYPEVFFIHGMLGAGLSMFSSDDARATLREQFDNPYMEITSFGVDLAYGLRIGYRNILQAEYRIQKGIGQKVYWDAADIDPLTGGRIEVEANVDSKEWLLKVNPFFHWVPPSIGVYFIYGQGEPEYLGDLGISFEDGDKTILGVEFTKLFRWYAGTVSFEYHDMSFGSYADEDTPPVNGTWDASYWMLQASFSAGYGE